MKINLSITIFVTLTFAPFFVSGFSSGVYAQEGAQEVANKGAEKDPKDYKEEHKGQKKFDQKRFDIEKMRKSLNLTDAQVKKIESIKKQYELQFKAHREAAKLKQQKLREIMNADPVDAKQVEAQMRAKSEDRIKTRLQMLKMCNEIGAVLTKEQKQKAQEQREKRRQEKSKEKEQKQK